MVTQIVGFFGLLIQVVLYAFLQEKPGTKWIVLCFGIFAVLPVLALAPLEYLWHPSETASQKEFDQQAIAEGSGGSVTFPIPTRPPVLRSCMRSSVVTLTSGTTS